MVDTTIFEKLGLIYKFLNNNSLIFLIILLVLALLFDYLYGNNNKGTKKLYITLISLILVYGLIEFYKPFINIIDIYITYLFKLAYFPSIIEYITMIIITIIIQIISIKNNNSVRKNINLWVGFIIEALFIVNLVALNNINIDLNNITSIYENNLLLSIFQTSSIVFMLWIVGNVIANIIYLVINNRIEIPKFKEEYE